MSAPTDVNSTWTTTGQIEGMKQQQNGTYAAGVTVSFQTGGGLTGSVWVPEAGYNADTVRAAIAARVATLVSIANLAG